MTAHVVRLGLSRNVKSSSCGKRAQRIESYRLAMLLWNGSAVLKCAAPDGPMARLLD